MTADLHPDDEVELIATITVRMKKRRRQYDFIPGSSTPPTDAEMARWFEGFHWSKILREGDPEYTSFSVVPASAAGQATAGDAETGER